MTTVCLYTTLMRGLLFPPRPPDPNTMTLETLHPGQRAPGGGLLVVGVPGRRRQELVRVDAGLGRRLAVHLAPYPEDGQGSGLFCDSTGWNASLSVERCNRRLNIQGIQRDARLTVMAAGMQICNLLPARMRVW